MFAQRHQKLVIELTRVMAVAVALLMLTVLTVSRSQAAFSANTDNVANGFNTGTVDLTDDDGGATALFNAVALSPGTPVENCIVVTYTGSLTPADIKLYGTSAGDLAPYLDTTVEVGSGGAFGDCTTFVPDAGLPLYDGTLSAFSTAHTDWSNGLATFTAPATSTAKTLKFTVEVQNTPLAQNKTATADFTWEAQDS
jgi:hypothetical protein